MHHHLSPRPHGRETFNPADCSSSKSASASSCTSALPVPGPSWVELRVPLPIWRGRSKVDPGVLALCRARSSSADLFARRISALFSGQAAETVTGARSAACPARPVGLAVLVRPLFRCALILRHGHRSAFSLQGGQVLDSVLVLAVRCNFIKRAAGRHEGGRRDGKPQRLRQLRCYGTAIVHVLQDLLVSACRGPFTILAPALGFNAVVLKPICWKGLDLHTRSCRSAVGPLAPYYVPAFQ